MHLAFVVTRTFETTRPLLAAATAHPQVRTTLVRSDADPREALAALAAADRIWFEGAGPVLSALAGMPVAAHLPRAYLHAHRADLAALPPDADRIVGEIVIDHESLLPEVGAFRASVAPDLATLQALVVKGVADASVEAWDAIRRVAEEAAGRVWVDPRAPRELGAYLTVSYGRTLANDPSEADTHITWPDLVGRGARVEVNGDVSGPAEAPPAPAPVSISAVIPVYNGAATIDRALAGLRRQTYPLEEILVVDDGSTDGTGGRVRAHFDDARVRYLYIDHVGQVGARNTGLREARGEYVLWLDADDEDTPNRARVLAEAAEAHPEADLFFSDALLVDPTGRVIQHRRYRDVRAADLPWMLVASLTGICPILHTSVMVRRALMARFGGYDPRFVRCEDYELWTRLAEAGDVVLRHVPATLIVNHRGPAKHGNLRIALDGFVPIVERLVARFGVEGVTPPLARYLHENPHRALGRRLLALGRLCLGEEGHPIYALAARHLREAGVTEGRGLQEAACRLPSS